MIDKLLTKSMDDEGLDDVGDLDKFGQANSLRNPKCAILERIRNELRIRGQYQEVDQKC